MERDFFFFHYSLSLSLLPSARFDCVCCQHNEPKRNELLFSKFLSRAYLMKNELGLSLAHKYTNTLSRSHVCHAIGKSGKASESGVFIVHCLHQQLYRLTPLTRCHLTMYYFSCFSIFFLLNFFLN